METKGTEGPSLSLKKLTHQQGKKKKKIDVVVILGKIVSQMLRLSQPPLSSREKKVSDANGLN